MVSRPAARRASSRKHSVRLRPKPSKKESSDSRAAMPPIRPPSSPSAALVNINKPMRPLTAYHMYFQIEREYIIQTTAGPVADASIHANKSYLADVPPRYRGILLRSDWYAAPGKRKKRKHRKSHGKIGFLELSAVVSRRWAALGETDPETLRFVRTIAARELEEYKSEMKRYKELAEDSAAPLSPSAAPAPAGAGAAAADAGATVISPVDSPARRPAEGSSFGVPPIMPDLPRSMQCAQPESAGLLLPSEWDFDSSASSVDDEIDYSICSLSNNGHYIPSPPELSARRGDTTHPDGIVYDPLFELDDGYSFQQPTEKRCVSPLTSDTNADNVDIIGDRGVFQLLSC